MKQLFSALKTKKIMSSLDKGILDYLPKILVSDQTASTNDDAKKFLIEQSSAVSIHLSEQQIAGKGRNGKKWISPKGKNIYLSLGWKSPLQYSELDGLSLSVGTVLATVLNTYTKNDINIKWPNDLVISQKKISGILIETVDIDGVVGIIIGIGINVHMSKKDGKDIDQSWMSLDEASEIINDRNEVVASLLNELLGRIIQFGYN